MHVHVHICMHMHVHVHICMSCTCTCTCTCTRAPTHTHAHAVYEQAERHFADTGQKEERSMVLEAWLDACTVAGDDAREAEVQAKMPKRVKKRRLMQSDDGDDAGWEEYFDFIFPDEEKKAPSLKILEMAHKWKKQKTGDDE